MIYTYKIQNKNIMILIQNADKSIIMAQDILRNPDVYIEQISQYTLALDTAYKAVVLTTQLPKTVDLSVPMNLYCTKVLAGGDLEVEKKIKAVIESKLPISYQNFVIGCKELYTQMTTGNQSFGTLTSTELRDNTTTYGDLNTLTKFEVGEIKREDLDELSDSDRIMDNETSILNLTVPTVYDLWQLFDVDFDDRDIVDKQMVTRTEKTEDGEYEEITEEKNIYAVTYETVDANVIFNIGIFNRNLATNREMINKLMETAWTSQNYSEEIINQIIGTKENSFLPIQANEKDYFNALTQLAKECLVFENYDESHGPIDLRKSVNFKILNAKPIENSISLEEAFAYVDVEELIKKGVKSRLFFRYIFWLSELALCATRPHLGFLKYPAGYNLAIESAMADINKEKFNEDVASESPAFNADNLIMQKPEALHYKEALLDFMLSLPSVIGQAEAVIKLMRWGSRKPSYLNVEEEPLSIGLEDFKVLFVADDAKEYKDEIAEDGSNRYITKVIVADSDITDFKMSEALTNPAKNSILGFIIRKKYEGIKAYEDMFIDLDTIIDEYVNNNNSMFKIMGIEYDKANSKFIIDQDLIMDIPNLAYKDKSCMTLTEMLSAYNKGLGTVDLVINNKIGEILGSERVDTVKYGFANFMSAYKEFSDNDDIQKTVMMYTTNQDKLYTDIMMVSRTGAKVKYINTALMVRFSEYFKTIINVSGDSLTTTETGNTFKEGVFEELFNQLKNTRIAVGELTVGATRETGIRKETEFKGLGQLYLNRIGDGKKEVLQNAIDIVDNTGKLVAYGLKGTPKVDKYYMKLYDPEKVEVKSKAPKKPMPIEKLLMSVAKSIIAKFGKDIDKYYKFFYGNISFSSETFRDYLKDNVVDWSKWIQ